MSEQNFFPFYPEKILRAGIIVLGSGAVLAGGLAAFLWYRTPSPFAPLESRVLRPKGDLPLTFSLDLNQGSPTLPIPNIEGEMTFSFAPPRPDESLQRPPLFVRLRKSAQSKRVALPARIDLLFENGLSFSDAHSPFWVELRSLGNHQIEGKVFVSTSLGNRIEVGTFVAAAQESPIQLPHEFPEGSPFRVLAEARWWGHDLFREKYGGGSLSQRLEFGALSSADLIELEEESWIAWQEGRWSKIGSLGEAKNRPIAHIASREGKALVLEGWDLEGHVRLSLLPAQSLPFKAKGDELFSSVRIRSEKQISCMLEKQCLILRVGDWVFKGENRWKILRKKEEKDAYLSGNWIGELFVFDKIEAKTEAKGGLKVVQGHLFNPGRSQIVPVEIAASSQRKILQNKDPSWLRKGKR